MVLGAQASRLLPELLSRPPSAHREHGSILSAYAFASGLADSVLSCYAYHQHT